VNEDRRPQKYGIIELCASQRDQIGRNLAVWGKGQIWFSYGLNFDNSDAFIIFIKSIITD
jgi:hypothetical protein